MTTKEILEEHLEDLQQQSIDLLNEVNQLVLFDAPKIRQLVSIELILIESKIRDYKEVLEKL